MGSSSEKLTSRITQDLCRKTPSAATQLVPRQPAKVETVSRPLFLLYVKKQRSHGEGFSLRDYGGISNSCKFKAQLFLWQTAPDTPASCSELRHKLG